MIKKIKSNVQIYIDKLKAGGDLIDIYSKEFISKNTTDYDLEDLLQVEKNHGKDFYGHMLILQLVDESDEAIHELIKIYKPFENVLNAKNRFGDIKHNPDFLFINLSTKQILSAGLGRKNRLFLTDVESNQAIEYSHRDHNISASAIFAKKNKTYYEKFTALDELNMVTRLVSALEELGEALHDHARCRFVLEQIEEIKETASFKDGIYFYEGEEISEEELNDEIDENNSANERMDDAIQVIKFFFPNAEIGELNTGDY
jgi:hypothetical protein